ncbi:hypothetical protein F2Q68_00029236 [Brassica cretica]|uniref:Uncharacterized protein n=1 Tax=Brassica cretica TaxID=69181 RepID=A0A8S9GED0_BRACR|nr:hypothetical protein F2Q68_00029236 [Brassica cretica]
MRETTVRRRVLMPHFQRETEYGQLYQGHGTFQFAPEVEMTPPTRGRGRPRKSGLTGKSLRPFRMQDSVPTRKRGRPRKTLSIDADRLRRITGVCRCGTLCRPSKDRVQSGREADWCVGTMGIRSGEPDGRSSEGGRASTYRQVVTISSSKEEVEVEEDLRKTSIMDERTSGGCTEPCKCEILVQIVHKPHLVREYTKEFLDMAEKCKSKPPEGGEDGREGDGSKGVVVKQVIYVTSFEPKEDP